MYKYLLFMLLAISAGCGSPSNPLGLYGNPQCRDKHVSGYLEATKPECEVQRKYAERSSVGYDPKDGACYIIAVFPNVGTVVENIDSNVCKDMGLINHD